MIATLVFLAAQPIVIAHRGASGYRPEHTIAAYELAIDQKADYIEPDLVITKDGELICRHENEISGTTDVGTHPEFADRKATKMVDGVKIEGWFTEDFTLAEIKTLRCKERLPQLRKKNVAYDGQFEVPTLREVLQLLVAKKASTGRSVGIYPETKHPTYFATRGLTFDAALLKTLREFDHFKDGKGAKPMVFIQSFEVKNLQKLKGMCSYPLIQLLDKTGKTVDGAGDFETMRMPAGLAAISKYATGIGPDKDLVIPRTATRELGEPTSLVKDAHKVGLKVHPYTFRRETFFLPAGSGVDIEFEIGKFVQAGIDGFFTDFPDLGRRALE